MVLKPINDAQENVAFRKKRFHRGKIVSSYIEDDGEENAFPNDACGSSDSNDSPPFDRTHNWLRFMNPVQQHAYEKYRRKRFHPTQFIIAIIVECLAICFFLCLSIAYPTGIFFSVICIVFLCTLAICSYIILNVRDLENHHSKHKSNYINRILAPYCGSAENVLIVLNSFFWGLMLLSRSISSNCDAYELQFFCPDVDEFGRGGVLSVDLVLSLLITTHMLQIFSKGVHFYALLCAWIVSLAFIVATFVLISAYDNPLAIYYAFTGIIILLHYENDTLGYYLSHLENFSAKADPSETVLTVRDAMTIITNITNDVMLHIQTLNNGIENVQKNLTELKTLLYEQSTQIHNDMRIHLLMQCAVQQETLSNLNVTNSFISMTLNKSHDFLQAYEGIPLEPAMHTIDLYETINWPLECVRGIQSLVPIDLEPIPSSICSQIVTDKSWLEENVACLAMNAAKYSGKGRISVRVVMLGTMLRVEVEDTGEGVPDDLKPSIFSLSKQVRRKTGGTGLGLFCFAKRLEALGGLYGVTDRPAKQKGAIFWFEFPYYCDVESAKARDKKGAKGKGINRCLSSLDLFDEKEQEERAEGFNLTSAGYSLQVGPLGLNNGGSANTSDPKSFLRLTGAVAGEDTTKSAMVRAFRHSSVLETQPASLTQVSTDTDKRRHIRDMKLHDMSVLVVDDSVPIFKMTSKALEARGHRVAYAENGAIALNIMKSNLYDVVLMDLQMPVMDGYESVRRLRQYEQGLKWDEQRHQVIAGVSASSDDKTKEAALLAGMDFFIPKPFTMARFMQVLDSLDYCT